jgi:hypothetical protein
MKMHISYVREMEESERVRRACLTYLQSCLLYFYPEQHDILYEMKEIAATLGGKLNPPSFPGSIPGSELHSDGNWPSAYVLSLPNSNRTPHNRGIECSFALEIAYLPSNHDLCYRQTISRLAI